MAPQDSQTLVSDSDSEGEQAHKLAEMERKQAELVQQWEEYEERKRQREERKRITEEERKRKEKEEEETECKRKEEEKAEQERAEWEKQWAQREKARKGRGRAEGSKWKAVEATEDSGTPAAKKAKTVMSHVAVLVTRVESSEDDSKWSPGREKGDDEGDTPKRKGKEKRRARGNYDDKGEKIKMGGDNECRWCRRLGRGCKAQKGDNVHPADADIPEHVLLHQLLVSNQQLVKEICGLRADMGRQLVEAQGVNKAIRRNTYEAMQDIRKMFDRVVNSGLLPTLEQIGGRQRLTALEQLREKEVEEERSKEREEEDRREGEGEGGDGAPSA